MPDPSAAVKAADAAESKLREAEQDHPWMQSLNQPVSNMRIPDEDSETEDEDAELDEAVNRTRDPDVS